MTTILTYSDLRPTVFYVIQGTIEFIGVGVRTAVFAAIVGQYRLDLDPPLLVEG